MPTFPNNWPNGCPPTSAPDATGEVHRVVHQPRQPEDFMSYAELGKGLTASPCKRHSLSVFNSHLSACHQAQKYPQLGDHVAKATLSAEMGKLSLPSPYGHQEWWSPEDFDRSAVFGEARACR